MLLLKFIKGFEKVWVNGTRSPSQARKLLLSISTKALLASNRIHTPVSLIFSRLSKPQDQLTIFELVTVLSELSLRLFIHLCLLLRF